MIADLLTLLKAVPQIISAIQNAAKFLREEMQKQDIRQWNDAWAEYYAARDANDRAALYRALRKISNMGGGV